MRTRVILFSDATAGVDGYIVEEGKDERAQRASGACLRGWIGPLMQLNAADRRAVS